MMLIKKQHGLTLVELMVAAALSLIIVGFITNIMLSGSRTAQQTEGIAQAQENGRFILNWLQVNARKAGFSGSTSAGKANPENPFADLCATAPSFTSGQPNQHCSFERATDSGDRLAIRRKYENATTTSQADLSTCSGITIPVALDGSVVIDTYWVNPSDSALWCATYQENGNMIGSATAIANDIQSMHILYGSEANEDEQYRKQVVRFTSLAEALALVDNDWSRIKAVRIGILTRSASTSAIDKASRRYIVLDANPLTFNDRIARHIQSTTIYLFNK